MRLDFSTNPVCVGACGKLLVSSREKGFDKLTHAKHESKGFCKACAYTARVAGILEPPAGTIDPVGQTCKKCDRFEVYEFFSKNSGTATGRNSTCKLCTRLSLYNLSRDRYEEILASQDSRCAICLKHVSEFTERLYVDHDHACCPPNRSCGSCVRGLLCNQCNHGIGCFKDNTDTMLQAIRYLKGSTTVGESFNRVTN